MITLSSVHKRYGQEMAVRDVSLHIRKGDLRHHRRERCREVDASSIDEFVGETGCWERHGRWRPVDRTLQPGTTQEATSNRYDFSTI